MIGHSRRGGVETFTRGEMGMERGEEGIDYNHIIIAWHTSILHHSHGRYIVAISLFHFISCVEILAWKNLESNPLSLEYRFLGSVPRYSPIFSLFILSFSQEQGRAKARKQRGRGSKERRNSPIVLKHIMSC